MPDWATWITPYPFISVPEPPPAPSPGPGLPSKAEAHPDATRSPQSSSQGASQSTWWEIQVAVDPEREDLVYWRLENFGCEGVASQVGEDASLHLKAYIPFQDATSLDLAALALKLRQDALLANCPAPQVSWERLEEVDWSSAWKAHWQPQEIGEEILVCPAWLEVPDLHNRHVITMDPGAAFGTGAHPTTQLCVEALEMQLSFLEPEEKVVLADIGCGSGILSIAAAKLGAAKVYSVDTDEFAVAATQTNARQNGVEEQLEIFYGSLEQVPRMVDGMVCNILAEVIVDLIPQFQLAIKEDGWLVLSGILTEQAKMVSETLEAHGWMVAALWKRKEWTCLNVRRH